MTVLTARSKTSSKLADDVAFVALLEVEEGVDNPLPAFPSS